MTENERLTIDEIIQHCNRTCENTEMLAIARGQNQEDITSKGYWEHYQVANYLEELKQYRAIGTIEEFKALKEKAEPKKPVLVKRGYIKFYPCPNPNCSNPNKYMQVYPKQKHCVECGQHLDWSEG